MIDPSCFRWPIVDEATVTKVAELLRAGRTSLDEELLSAFEAELCAYFGVKHALLTCNGTSAALSCYHALGLGPGDEVIGPALTHWATLLPAVRLGCRVVFADLDPDSLSISVEDVAGKITAATRAVAVCHMFGNPADLRALRNLCRQRELYLIEDLSHAVGATVGGAPVGSFGHVAFFSMQASKMISAGEGGALLTNDSQWYARALALGHPKRRGQLPQPAGPCGDSSLGYKFRPSPLLVLLGRESFRRLDEQNAVRREMFLEIRRRLGDLGDVHFPEAIPAAQRVWFEYNLLLGDRLPGPAEIAARLREQGVIAEAAKYDYLPDLPQFQGGPQAADCPHARRHRDRLLLLSPFKRRGYEVLEAYVAALRQALAGDRGGRIPTVPP